VTTPVSPNPISLDNVQTEFGGINPIEIAEYYAGGSYVPATISGIPASGQIGLQDFYNKTKIIYTITVNLAPSNAVGTLNATLSTTNNLPSNGYINFIYTYPNGTSVLVLTNQAINQTYSIGISGSSVGYGNGSITAYGYDNANTLLATGSVNYTITAPSTYAFNNPPSSIDEGGSGTFNITTANVSDGTILYWVITNSTTSNADFNSISGSFTINSNSGSFTIYATADITTEGPETFTVTVKTNGLLGTPVLTSGTITISDTSVAVYSLSRNLASVNEGSNFTIAFTTNQSGSFPYTIGGTGITSADIGGAALTGNITNGDQLTYTATADSTTEGPEIFTLSLNNGLASVSVTINDTSLTPATYSFTRSVASVNEGGSFYVDFSTNQSGNFSYTITGVSSADIGGADLTGVVTNGSRLTYSVTADNVTEGAETFTITSMGATASVTINDTSRNPFYTIGRSAAAVNEGESFTIYFTTNQSGSFPYTITGVSSADIGGAALTGSVSNGAELTYTATADSLTEGTEVFAIRLDNGLSTTVTVSILDTSLTPATYSFTRSVASVNEGGSFYVDFSTNQSGNFAYTITGVTSADISSAALTGVVTNGSRLTYTVAADATTEGAETFNIALDNGLASTSVSINDTSVTPATYSFTRSVASVDEGGTFSITFNTNQAGSYAYYISGVNSADIGGADMSGVLANGNVLNYTATADSTTEGVETFTITSSTGATASVTINDTSITPDPPPVIDTFGITPATVYPDTEVTITWTTTNAVHVILYLYNPSGQAIVGQFVDVDGNYVLAADASRQLGTWTAILYAYNSAFTVSTTASRAFNVVARPPTPDFSYAFAEPTSTANTNNVVIYWSTTNAAYVLLYVLNPAGTYSVGQYVDAGASNYTFTGSSTRDIGTYNVYLYAYNSDYTLVAQRAFTFTLTAPASVSFTATLTNFISFPDQRSGPNVYFDETNRRISVYARNNHSISYYGIAYYTLSAPGYIYCFLDVGSETNYDWGYFYVNGSTVNTTPSYLHTTNGNGGYSGGYGTYDSDGAGGAQVFNNVKIGPLAAGSHYILILYTKDGSVSRNGDYISAAWNWSPD
jgi:hypothetical protein